MKYSMILSEDHEKRKNNMKTILKINITVKEIGI